MEMLLVITVGDSGWNQSWNWVGWDLFGVNICGGTLNNLLSVEWHFPQDIRFMFEVISLLYGLLLSCKYRFGRRDMQQVVGIGERFGQCIGGVVC